MCPNFIDAGIKPDDGAILVSGTGGVGSVSVGLLASMGYEVVAKRAKPIIHF